MGRKKINFSKSMMKLYLLKQLKKVPGLNLNSLIHPRSLTSTCNYPKTQSIDKRNSNVNFITNHESGLAEVNRYLLENFPSMGISDDESPLIDTSTKQSPNEEFLFSTSNSLVVPSSPTGNIREEAAGLVVALSNNDSSSIDTSAKQSPASREEFSSATSNSFVVPSSPISDIREGKEGVVVVVTFSIDPYKDFKRSMKTMLKADNASKSQPSNQDNWNELLLCYLEQNNKSMHKHVLKAFNDITNQISNQAKSQIRTKDRKRTCMPDASSNSQQIF